MAQTLYLSDIKQVIKRAITVDGYVDINEAALEVLRVVNCALYWNGGLLLLPYTDDAEEWGLARGVSADPPPPRRYGQ